MDIETLHNVNLLNGMNDHEIGDCIRECHGYEKKYKKGEYILHYGSTDANLGIILEGKILIETSDQNGIRSIVSVFHTGQAFAETYAYFHGVPMSVDVVADSDCRLMFLDISMIRTSQLKTDSWYLKLMKNMLTISNRKNLTLMERNIHISSKSVRERIMSYLDTRKLQTGRDEFNIPFDRQQLADYLNVERTALSRELSRMKKDHLIDYRKNHFKVLYDFQH